MKLLNHFETITQFTKERDLDIRIRNHAFCLLVTATTKTIENKESNGKSLGLRAKENIADQLLTANLNNYVELSQRAVEDAREKVFSAFEETSNGLHTAMGESIRAHAKAAKNLETSREAHADAAKLLDDSINSNKEAAKALNESLVAHKDATNELRELKGVHEAAAAGLGKSEEAFDAAIQTFSDAAHEHKRRSRFWVSVGASAVGSLAFAIAVPIIFLLSKEHLKGWAMQFQDENRLTREEIVEILEEFASKEGEMSDGSSSDGLRVLE